MIEAKNMKKILNTKWIEEQWEELKNNQTGRKVWHIGRHVVGSPTSDKFAEELVGKGFIISYGINSHGVKLLIAEW